MPLLYRGTRGRSSLISAQDQNTQSDNKSYPIETQLYQVRIRLFRVTLGAVFVVLTTGSPFRVQIFQLDEENLS